MDDRKPIVKLNQNVISLLKYLIYYPVPNQLPWAFQLLSREFLDSPKISGAVPGPLTIISKRVIGNFF